MVIIDLYSFDTKDRLSYTPFKRKELLIKFLIPLNKKGNSCQKN